MAVRRSSLTALLRGNGGRVSIWADRSTRFLGSISARGGLQVGDGGFVEVSGKDTLNFGGRVDLTATNGGLGTLLLDPTNILISNAVVDSPGVAAALPYSLSSQFSRLGHHDFSSNFGRATVWGGDRL